MHRSFSELFKLVNNREILIYELFPVSFICLLTFSSKILRILVWFLYTGSSCIFCIECLIVIIKVKLRPSLYWMSLYSNKTFFKFSFSSVLSVFVCSNLYSLYSFSLLLMAKLNDWWLTMAFYCGLILSFIIHHILCKVVCFLTSQPLMSSLHFALTRESVSYKFTEKRLNNILKPNGIVFPRDLIACCNE